MEKITKKEVQKIAESSIKTIAFMKNLALVGALLMLYAVPLPWAYAVL